MPRSSCGGMTKPGASERAATAPVTSSTCTTAGSICIPTSSCGGLTKRSLLTGPPERLFKLFPLRLSIDVELVDKWGPFVTAFCRTTAREQS
ncbi:hypothetical protein ARTSIC4J27_3504 [Pseudarthrobacter siccitolerans]|uniref:Uncharacterized protein n=1 Tax=Pseudarthrobacter siccitolerans TaxID=861266 RepID=A0A024H5T9_9MICC|nr:hypothetical protein ARTSIC4J27_3504 [Pseudarthrobacter siccitolerans]